MFKSYLSCPAKRQARQERVTKVAKMPKISAFLKPACSDPMTTSGILAESKSVLISATAAVAIDIGNQDSTSETTVIITLPMDSGNENKGISITSTIIQGDIEKTVEFQTAQTNPSDKANFREDLSNEDHLFWPMSTSWPFSKRSCSEKTMLLRVILH